MKKKYFIAWVVILLAFGSTSAQTTLAAGDIAITGFNSDTVNDEFTFVLLTDTTVGTTINFTDNGWLAAGGFRDFEGTVTWTSTTDLTCGTEVFIQTVSSNVFTASVGTAVSTNNGFALSASGDQILAYQGPDATPTFIYAINFDSAGWSDATSARDTALPTGLTDTVDAVDVGETDSGNYNCTVTNGIALVLAAVSNNANWTLSNSPITIGGCYYTCCIATTTWDGANWTPIAPDNTYSVIINGNYSTAANFPGSFEACNITVNVGNTLSILDTDYVLSVNDVVIDGTILVAHEASFVQVNDASTVTLNGAGIGTVQKNATPQEFYSYTYWSSPFVNEIIGETGSGLDLVPSNRIFGYDASNYEDVAPADGFDDNNDDWTVASGPMIPGKGYAVFAQSSAMPFPQTQGYIFDGEFNNGPIATAVTLSANVADPNWNFLGNPYPSGISSSAFLAHPDNTGLAGTIYLWTHNSNPLAINPGPDDLNFSVDDYASYTPGSGGVAAVTGGTIPTGIIASGQGFFVEATPAASGTATFNNAMRVTAGNDNFYRANDRIWVNLENDLGAFSQILVTFSENATAGYDRLYDGKRLDAGSYISFFSLIENLDEHYAIQGREPLTEEETIILGFKNLVEGENEYKISIDHAEGILETSEVFLVDKLLNITHDLNSGEYRFNSEQGVFKERFELLLRSELPIDPLGEDELIIVKEPNSHLAFSTTNNSDIANIKLFDILGRLLYDIDVLEEQEATYRFDNLNKTIFIAKATLASGKVLTKKSLK